MRVGVSYRIGRRAQRPDPRDRQGQALRILRNLDFADRGLSAFGPGRGIHRSLSSPKALHASRRCKRVRGRSGHHRAEPGWVLAIRLPAYSVQSLGLSLV